MRRSFAALLTAAMLLGGVATNGAAATAQEAGETSPTERTSRLRGVDRFATAVAISQHGFPDGAPVVYLARGDVYVDAVAGGMLDDGPILLVKTTGAPPVAVLDEVERLGATRVVALGGTSAVSQQVLEDVARGRVTSRLRGPDRYATAVAISRHVFPDGGGPQVILATNATDALIAATNTDVPVLLLPPRGPMPEVVGEELHRLGAAEARLVVHEGATVRAVEAWAFEQERQGRPSILPAVSAYGGRLDEAQEQLIAEHHSPIEVPNLYVGRSDDPVDAIAAGAAVDGPVILVPPCEFTMTAWWVAERTDPGHVFALGGPQAVCDDVLAELGAIARAPFPPAPGPVDLDIGVARRPLAWSADGRMLVADANYNEPLLVDTASGRTTPIEPLEGWVWDWPEDASVASDGSVVWLPLTLQPAESWDPYRYAIVAHFPDGSRSPQIVAEGQGAFANGASMIVGHTERQDDGTDRTTSTVHNFEAGTSWTLPATLDLERLLRIAADGSHVLVGDRPFAPTSMEAWYSDGRVELVLPQRNGPCGPVARHDLLVSADLTVATWSQYVQPQPCSGDPDEDGHAVVEDVATGAVTPLALLDGEPTHSHPVDLTSDGGTALIALYGESLTRPDGEWSNLMEDGPRLDGLPPLDGEVPGIVAVDLDRLGTESAYAVLPLHPQLPQLGYPLAGPKARQYAWSVNSLSVSGIRLRNG